MRTNLMRAVAVMILAAWCAGCGDGSGDGGGSGIASHDLGGLAGMPFFVAVTGGGTTGSYAIMGPGIVYTNLTAINTTDIGVTAHGNAVFIFGRYKQDWLARFDLDDTRDPVYQYSTKALTETSMNPRAVAIVDNDTGYVFRYQSDISWIIDPSPADEAGFKRDEIDLSAYATGSAPAYPANPVKALVDGTVMYVILERTNNWTYDVPAVLLTFNISIPGTPAITDAHDLIVRSPNQMVKLGDKLYIAGWGITSFSKGGHTPLGGIEEVDLSGGAGAYISTLRVDDDDPLSTNHDRMGNDYRHGGYTADVAVVSATHGFVYIAEWNHPAIYKIHPFNPSTGVVDTGTAILNGVNLSRIAIGPDGLLYCAASAWYGLGADAGVYLVSPVTLQVLGPIRMGLEPIDFTFNKP
ncbi:MAG: hypothetical protein ABIF71_03865 [Planctomycetota bacterium]